MKTLEKFFGPLSTKFSLNHSSDLIKLAQFFANPIQFRKMLGVEHIENVCEFAEKIF